ncbi:MAG: phosphonate metabolism protein/1,5-bisphosphokinase (PRPP-forming) PhnN [Marinosulfonomonas sp.]
MPGMLIAVVGPSGVGKDTIMAEVLRQRPEILCMRRVITRDADCGGESFDGVSVDEFLEMEQDGKFALSWQAHGLHYGVPGQMDDHLADGRCVMFNGSRAQMAKAVARYPEMLILSITANNRTLAERLASRGRETAQDIEKRLDRAKSAEMPAGSAVEIRNDGPLAEAVVAVLAAIDRTREPVR